jgi:hypothetical protein
MTYDPTREALDLTELRARLRGMSDSALKQFGRAAQYMASPAASYSPPREEWGLQLAEARKEWPRRAAPHVSEIT